MLYFIKAFGGQPLFQIPLNNNLIHSKHRALCYKHTACFTLVNSPSYPINKGGTIILHVNSKETEAQEVKELKVTQLVCARDRIHTHGYSVLESLLVLMMLSFLIEQCLVFPIHFYYSQPKTSKLIRNKQSGDFPGGPVVKNLPSSAGHVSLIPGQGTRVPHTMEHVNLCAATRQPVSSNY